MNLQKRHVLCLFLCLLATTVWAQKGLHINPYFDGRFNKDPQVVSVIVKGKPLKKFHLTLYRSMTFNDEMDVLKNIERDIVLDTHDAIEKESGQSGDRLLYGFYCLKPAVKNSETLRYIFYRHTQKKAILVYMEGQAQMDDLKRMFKK